MFIQEYKQNKQNQKLKAHKKYTAELFFFLVSPPFIAVAPKAPFVQEHQSIIFVSRLIEVIYTSVKLYFPVLANAYQSLLGITFHYNIR